MDYHDFDDNNGGRESWGISAGEYQRNYSLNHMSYDRNSKKFFYNDPNKGQQVKTPFKDDILKFDWDKDRNVFNIVPGKGPEGILVYTGYGYVIIYVDKSNNIWTKDSSIWGWLNVGHGKDNSVYRGTGAFQGSQAVFDKEGNLVTSGEHRGTFDYYPAWTLGHVRFDMWNAGPYSNPDRTWVDN